MKFGDLRRRGDSEPLSEESRPVKFGDLRPRNSPQAEPEKADGSILDTIGNAVDRWKDNSPAGAGFLGGLASETAGNILQGLGDNFGEDTWRRRALKGAGDLAQSAADEMLNFAANHFDVSNEDNGVTLPNRFMSGLTGGLGNLARMIHSDKSADALSRASELTANKKRVSTDDLIEYFTNPYGFQSDIGELAGSVAITAPFMGLVPEAAVARGVAALGGDCSLRKKFELVEKFALGSAFLCAAEQPLQEQRQHSEPQSPQDKLRQAVNSPISGDLNERITHGTSQNKVGLICPNLWKSRWNGATLRE